MSENIGTIGPITRVQIARYAGATRDFNRIHVDEEFARQVGLPSVVAHGPLIASLVLDRLLAVFGNRGWIRSLDCRLRAAVFPGDELRAEVDSQGGLTVTRQDGTVVITGHVELSPTGEAVSS